VSGVRERLRPFVQEREAAGEFPRDLYAEMGDLGFFGCVYDESLGEVDVGFAALAAVAEQLACSSLPPPDFQLTLEPVDAASVAEQVCAAPESGRRYV
jgi:alkylation response protein AidB-like acyl-CoA dehydrogenase